MKMILTPEELTKLKKVAALLPKLEAIAGAPAPRTDAFDDESDDAHLRRKIGSPSAH